MTPDRIPTIRIKKLCPFCDRSLNIRAARTARGRSGYDPDEVVLTVRCPRSDCGEIVPLTAGDLHLVA